MNLIESFTSEIVELYPDRQPRELREQIADSAARVLVEQQIGEIRKRAIEQVRQAILPLVDAAIAKALDAAEHAADESWARWQKILADTTGENSVPVQ